jgi:hypothetical protein
LRFERLVAAARRHCEPSEEAEEVRCQHPLQRTMATATREPSEEEEEEGEEGMPSATRNMSESQRCSA